ncbi:hypothetical protein JD844_004918, partial [Phrynosoma platyrhinos]
VLADFCRFYEEQYGVALFNSVRYEIEGGGGPQPQLLHRKVPLEERTIFSGNVFQYLEENKKWRNRFSLVPHNYGLVLYENKLVRRPFLLDKRGNACALLEGRGKGPTPKSGNASILKCPTQFPLILWHPYARHYYFCVMTGKEQEKWRAVFQDCVRHCNNGIPEDSKVEAPAFTDAVLSNLVMEELLPELKNMIGPRLKGKAQERHRVWIQVSDAVYRMVYDQTKARYDAAVTECDLQRCHGFYTFLAFSFSHLQKYMEKLSQLAFHPVKMQSCYEKMDQLKLEGLQQRFDVSSASVFKQRAQILMRQQMDDTVYTFETLLHQELGKSLSKDELCKAIQRILERVLKKYDYDSSTVRKKFFREALLQITIPFLLKKLAPTCKGDLARFQELIFEDFARFILVENTYEEVVLQSVMKDIMMAVKEAAVQRKHNLYRDSIVMHNSDPNLHLLGEGTPINWGEEFGSQEESDPSDEKQRRAKQVVSVIHTDEGTPSYDVTSLEASPDATEPEESEVSPTPPTQDSPSSLKELRTMLVKEFHVESPIAVGGKAEEPLGNGTVIQESKGIEEHRGEEKEEEAAAQVMEEHLPEGSAECQRNAQEVTDATPADETPSPAADRGSQGDHREPDDKETGEVATQVQEVKAEPSLENSPGVTDNSEGTQTQF